MLWGKRIYFAPDGEGGGGGGGGEGGGGGGEGGGGGGGGAASWRDGLPDDLKGNAVLAKFNDVPSVAKSYIELEKQFGADKLVLPGKDAKADGPEWAAVFDKLGRPKAADEYTIPEVKDRPYTDTDKAVQAAFRPIAHKLGLSQSQVDGIVAFQNERTMEALATATKIAGDSEAALRLKHGDQYDAKMAAGNVALESVLNAASIDVKAFRQVQLSDGSFLGDNKQFAGLFIALGELVTPTGFEGGSGGGGPASAFASPAAAKAELDRLYAKEFKDQSHPFNVKRDPQHKFWSDRVMALEALANKPGAEKK